MLNRLMILSLLESYVIVYDLFSGFKVIHALEYKGDTLVYLKVKKS